MGDNAHNFYPGAHYQPGPVLIGIKPTVHYGAVGPSTAPHEAVGAGLAAIRGATSLSAFQAAMADEYPTWWPTYAQMFGPIGYAVVTALPG